MNLWLLIWGIFGGVLMLLIGVLALLLIAPAVKTAVTGSGAGRGGGVAGAVGVLLKNRAGGGWTGAKRLDRRRRGGLDC